MKTEAKLSLEQKLQEWIDSDEFINNQEVYIPNEALEQMVNAIDNVFENWKTYEKTFPDGA